MASCTSSPPSGSAPSASVSAAVASTAPTTVAAREDDDIKPVYPQTKDPPDPVAQRYCDLIHERAEAKRKECCPSTPVTPFRPTAECVRTLSYALRASSVAIDKAALDACDAAVTEASKRCDWGGTLPAACEGLIAGTVAEKALCRSSLECKEGLFCAGLGATKPGTCQRPGGNDAPCGGNVDTLAAFVRQEAERAHPTCEGYCARRRCATVAAAGQTCASSLQCGKGGRCAGGKCTNAPLPKAGEPCPDKVCGDGLSCIKDRCVVEKRIDEACSADAECRSKLCEKKGAEGKCAVSCAIIRPAPTASGAP